MKTWRIVMLVLTIIIWMGCICFMVITNYDTGWLMATVGWFIVAAFRLKDMAG